MTQNSSSERNKKVSNLTKSLVWNSIQEKVSGQTLSGKVGYNIWKLMRDAVALDNSYCVVSTAPC